MLSASVRCGRHATLHFRGAACVRRRRAWFLHFPAQHMRVLLISYHHSSDGEVGGLRWTGLAKYLASHGWETWYLTAAPPPASAAQAIPGVTVESIAPGHTVSELYRRMRRAAPVPLPPSRAELSGNGRGKAWRTLLRPLSAMRSEASGLLYRLSEGE